ncbi:MAG: hypothetical protein Kow0065_03700 [Methylomicrobium sp.]
MNNELRQQLQAEQAFLRRDLADTPTHAKLTRMSIAARLRKVEAELSALASEEWQPARAHLTFDGVPVIGSHGIFADFGMKAVSSFTDAVASVAASLVAPLASMGPIRNRDQNQLLITNTAIGSFGFELEEFRGSQVSMCDESPVSIALERTQALLQSTLQSDDELADVASEIDPRALEKIRAFLKVLADNEAVCALQFKGHGLRFADVGQVRNSLEKLATENLREWPQQLSGRFEGVLPQSRNFEFRLAEDQQVIRGKVAVAIQNIDDINQHLHQSVCIETMTTQVGNGKPRYLLTKIPAWDVLQNAEN